MPTGPKFKGCLLFVRVRCPTWPSRFGISTCSVQLLVRQRGIPQGSIHVPPLMATLGASILGCRSCLFLTQQPRIRLYVPVLIVSFVLVTCPFTESGDFFKSAEEYHTKDGICKSMDIRNSLETFERLRGCRVVEGFVQILLFDNVNETLLSTISFPQLVEITDYLLLYRVNGLRSIGQLFPNLSVIRGQNNFYRYSLVVFEMSSLQEIALHSLVNITNGAVRIDKNPSLCFIKSIDWEKIVTNFNPDTSYINSIKPENECPICPGEEVSKDNYEKALTCPMASYKSGYEYRKRHLCWNRDHCQLICKKECVSCNFKGECCHPSCLGGCADNDTLVCQVCNNFEIWEDNVRKCVDKCPENTLEFLGRRCITKEECRAMPRPLNLPNSESPSPTPYKIHKNQCVLKCPGNMNDVKGECKPCGNGRCVKLCNGVNIDSVQIARQLTGCTRITGSLEIQIRGGSNVVNELEESLSMIEEIDGYLKVVRSFPLVSLHFFRSLKRIKGNVLDNQKYVFVVLDNQNLQDLWDWKNRSMKIDNGRLFFHFNPKLCIDRIETLQNETNLSPPFTELEVASNSNGDKIACNMGILDVTIKDIQSKAVTLTWKHFHLDDHRNLLGYIVYSIETKYQNLSFYDGRDACGDNGWRADDVSPPVEKNQKMVVYPITQLKPYTQYAFYVRTYTIAKENKGAQMQKIQYFTTAPERPTQPMKLTVASETSDSLRIKWEPPANPNGNVTYYVVTGKKRHDNNSYVRSYDSCKDDTFGQPPPPVPKPIPKEEPPITFLNGTCSCDDKKSKKHTINEELQDARNKFEDFLQNEVYVKRDQTDSRKKRDTSEINYNTQLQFPKPTLKPQLDMDKNIIGNTTENGTDLLVTFYQEVSTTELGIKKLHHYTDYDITVKACRNQEGPHDHDLCSIEVKETGRTLVKAGADDIKEVIVVNQSMDQITVRWDELPDPNGLVFKYIIEYERNVENAKASKECITHQDFIKQGKTYTLKLSPGNYSLRVLARTMGNNGKFSPYISFVIKDSNSATILILTVIVMPIIMMGFVTLFLCYRKQRLQKETMRLIQNINPEYMPSVYIPDEWEVPRKNIELIKELGQGGFGMVYEGIVSDIKGKPYVKCAIKTVNEHSTNRERLEFLNEATVMKTFDTAHVVRLLGVVSQGQPPLVIMELMANGDLKSYLRSHRPDENSRPGSDKYPSNRKPPSLKQIMQMAIEIADGMAYLTSMKYVHRDLAARNCMVSENLVVKIGDFGMTRDIYETDYYRKGTKGLLPVRWMAPESLKDGVFTSSSDVWSYGVVLWEMATLASQPYQGLSNDQVLRYVIDGGVMERPENCPDKLYTLMRYCWQHKDSARPTFLKLCQYLLDDASESFAEVSFYHSAAGQEARSAKGELSSPSQDDPNTPLRPQTVGLGENFTLTQSDDDSELESETHISFPNVLDHKNGLAANGYVGGRPTNGAATTQC